MESVVIQLFDRSPRIKPAPPSYEGSYEDFYDEYVEPNLPAPDRVVAFDALLARHFAEADPEYLIRSVLKLDRRESYRNRAGHLLLPTDNSPAWWLHSYLLTDLPLDGLDNAEFFWSVPRHMYDIRLRTHLAKAGFHLAHIVNAKNRDTQWETWTAAELQRRMIFSIHPWNWCLVGKPEWARNGGRADILDWIQARYVVRYGADYQAWRKRHGLAEPPMHTNPVYSYSTETSSRPTSTISEAQPGPRPLRLHPPVAAGGLEHQSNRTFVRRDWKGRSITLRMALSEGRFAVPHDRLLEWALANTNVENTVSWNRNGLYSWPRATQDMLAFLRDHRER